MKKIVMLTLFVLIAPFLAIGALLYFHINVFDNPDFWYGYMAFFGTVLLGAIALGQSHKANAINDRLLNMQEESQQFQIKEKAAVVDVKPIIIDAKKRSYVVKDDDYADAFDVVNQKYKYFFFHNCQQVDHSQSRYFNVVLEIKNISDTILKEIHINDFRIYDIYTNQSNVTEEKGNIREYAYAEAEEYAQCMLRPNETVQLCLKIAMDEYDMTQESFHMNFNLSTMSIYNVIFSENITIQRNNVADTKERAYVTIESSYFMNAPQAIEP